MNDTKKLQKLLIKEGFLEQGEDDGIFGPKTKQAYINYLNANRYSPPLVNINFDERSLNEQKINSTYSNIDIINYANQDLNIPYIIDDKVNDKLHVYYNGQLLRSFDAIHGKYSKSFGNTFNKKVGTKSEYTIRQGDTLSQIAKNNGMTLSRLLEVNPQFKIDDIIYPNQKLVIDTTTWVPTEINPDESTITYVDENGHTKNLAGNMTTPAGVYFTTRTLNYKGAPSFIRQTEQQISQGVKEGIPNSIHVRTIKENANTNGCTGMSCKSLQELGQLLEGYEKIPTYILPADARNKFKIRNGALIFDSHDYTKTPNYAQITYNPINKIDFSKLDLNDEQKYIVKRFSKGLIDYKKELQEDLGINSDTYNKLARYAIGILGVESSYGKTKGDIENFFRAALKNFGLSNTNADYRAEYTLTQFIKGGDYDLSNQSIGLTQIRTKNLNDYSKELFRKWGITHQDLVYSPEKAAIATMIRLTQDFFDRGQNIDKAIKSYNPDPNYINRVKRIDSKVKIEEQYNTNPVVLTTRKQKLKLLKRK